MTGWPRLAGKVVLVTGTSRNIGGVAAAGLAAAGARVACNDLRADRADDAAGTIRTAGGEAIAVPGDVTDEQQMAAAVGRILQTWGTIDVLVCNAVRFDQRGVLTMPVGGDGTGSVRNPGQQPHPHRNPARRPGAVHRVQPGGRPLNYRLTPPEVS